MWANEFWTGVAAIAALGPLCWHFVRIIPENHQRKSEFEWQKPVDEHLLQIEENREIRVKIESKKHYLE